MTPEQAERLLEILAAITDQICEVTASLDALENACSILALTGVAECIEKVGTQQIEGYMSLATKLVEQINAGEFEPGDDRGET